jgi:hypothetical protein
LFGCKISLLAATLKAERLCCTKFGFGREADLVGRTTDIFPSFPPYTFTFFITLTEPTQSTTMHFSATTFIALASLAVQSSLALVIPKDVSSSEIHNIVAREPHFFQIREPAPDYTLYSPNPAVAGTEGSFEFKALDGEQSSEYHVKVYLENDAGSKTEVSLLRLLFFGIVETKVEHSCNCTAGQHSLRWLRSKHHRQCFIR